MSLANTTSAAILDGFSKHTYECPLCHKLKHAHEFTIFIGNDPVRDARLFCRKCLKKFNAMLSHARADFLRKRFEEHYGSKQFVYGLFDPRNKGIRYIGRASDLKRRYQQHLRKSKNYIPRPHITVPSSKEWIAELLEIGSQPQMQVLETVSPSVKICEQEMRWICQSIKEGCDLLNAENSSEEIGNFIKGQSESFMTVSLDKLIRSKFISTMEDLLLSRESGWRRAVTIHALYKDEPNIVASR